MPDISLCIPTYNGGRYLAETLASVEDQVFSGTLEVLVVDDGSTDDTVSIARQFAARTRWPVQVHVNSQNQGLVGNWNACLRMASGNWIKLLFQDDTLTPDALTAMHCFGEQSGAALVLCDRRYVFEPDAAEPQKAFLEHTLVRLSHYHQQDTFLSPADLTAILNENFLKTNFLGEPVAGLLRKDVVAAVGLFDPHLKQICDLEYWLRVGLNYGIAFTPAPHVNFRVHGTSTTKANSLTLASITDRILLGEKLIEHSHYEAYRRHTADPASAERTYRARLGEYIDRYGYFPLQRQMPRTASATHFRAVHPGWWAYAKHLLRQQKRKWFTL